MAKDNAATTGCALALSASIKAKQVVCSAQAVYEHLVAYRDRM